MDKATGRKSAQRTITALEAQHFSGPGKLKIGDGLYLVVTRQGGRRWVFRFSYAGKQRELFLAPAERMSLKDAKDKAKTAAAIVQDGKDPRTTMSATARRARQYEAAGIPTFGELADRYIEAMAPTFKNAKARQPWELSLKTYAAPIRPLRVNAVSTWHIVDLLKPIWHKKPETAQRVRRRIEAVFGEAIVRGFRENDEDGKTIGQRNPASWKHNLDRTSLKSRKVDVRHHAALPYADVPEFMADIRSRESMAARALELCILTATRTGETIAAQWSEFDLKAGTWTIPKTRMKAGKEHVIPLSSAAMALVKGLEQYRGSPFLFPGVKGDKHMSNMSMAMLLRRMGRDEITVHGFRSAFRDWASEVTQFPQEVAEMALAHTITSKVERAYRRGDLFVKRRNLMDAWADYCLPAKGGKVVPLRKA
jgi:integrase